MKEIKFIRWLSLYDRSRQSLKTEKGQVLNFVIQYETYIKDKWHPIVRYDTAHGFFHKDIIYPDGSATKKKLPTIAYAEAFTQAELDIKINWQTYRNRYLEEMKK